MGTPNKKMVKACTRCKQRKKKCTGDLPCEYCSKINQPEGCEYKARVKSKVAKVTERYINSLKSRIRELEVEVAKGAPGSTLDYDNHASASDINPLLEPTYGLEFHSKNELEPKTTKRYLGTSACAQFLRKVKQSIADTCNEGLLSHDPSYTSGTPLATDPEGSIDRGYIANVVAEHLPNSSDAQRLISNASKMIGADYLFIEPQYFELTVERMFYRGSVPKHAIDLIQFSVELLRFVSYLALGSLFDKTRQGSKSLSVRLHSTCISIYGQLTSVYDQAASTSMVQSLLCIAYFALSQNKTTFAFTMVGNAIRIMFTLGYHKSTQSQRENRTFWLCFIYDRLLAVRFGFPLMIDEREINVPVFDQAEGAQRVVSLDMYHFVAQVRLAMVTTQVITKIYIQNPFSFLHNCHLVLRQLKSWFDLLPDELKFDYNNIKSGLIRSTFNLHINYNYSIMITTRPVLLYVFNVILTKGSHGGDLFENDQFNLILDLLESCIQAAEIQSRILAKLYYDDKMAVNSFLDCHYIFSATIILILAGYCQMLMKKSVLYSGGIECLFDAIKNNLNFLQRLSEHNIVARNFNEQLTEFIDMMSSEQVVQVLNPDTNDNQPYILFSRSTQGQTFLSNDQHSEEKEFNIADVGFVDLSELLDNMNNQFLSGTSVDDFLNANF
ncbi:LADA_0B11540g1_1 [Lachancea dasiensis]|uniref:LADA_0B11540g1_1 n=1 Tax=Lachancea dasiensis TaxID=1072105 RepID=A0A1G4IWE6_9SACH|nr:LADA_0B11540g1_1 [Lachancea dasiensis]